MLWLVVKSLDKIVDIKLGLILLYRFDVWECELNWLGGEVWGKGLI